MTSTRRPRHSTDGKQSGRQSRDRRPPHCGHVSHGRLLPKWQSVCVSSIRCLTASCAPSDLSIANESSRASGSVRTFMLEISSPPLCQFQTNSCPGFKQPLRCHSFTSIAWHFSALGRSLSMRERGISSRSETACNHLGTVELICKRTDAHRSFDVRHTPNGDLHLVLRPPSFQGVRSYSDHRVHRDHRSAGRAHRENVAYPHDRHAPYALRPALPSEKPKKAPFMEGAAPERSPLVGLSPGKPLPPDEVRRCPQQLVGARSLHPFSPASRSASVS